MMLWCLTWYKECALGSVEVPQLMQELLHRKIATVLLQERGKFTQFLEIKELVKLHGKGDI